MVHPLTFLGFLVDFAWKSCVWVAFYEKITNLMILFWVSDRSSESDRGILRETIWEIHSFSLKWTCMNSGWWLTYVHWAQFLSVSNFMNFALFDLWSIRFMFSASMIYVFVDEFCIRLATTLRVCQKWSGRTSLDTLKAQTPSVCSRFLFRA